MQNKFTINGTKYTAAPFDFNTVCDLEELGMSLQTVAKSPMTAVRAYFAICAGIDRNDAGNEIQSHVIEGGSLDPLIEAMNKELEASDFFRALSKDEEENDRPGTLEA